MKLIIIGPQASGKGTQANLLSKKLNIKHIGTGDILRAEIRSNSILGKQVKELINKGHLISDDLINLIIKKAIEDHPEGFILDGYPRTVDQAKFLEEVTIIDKVILLTLSDEVSIDRIVGRRICSGCGRNYHIKYSAPVLEGVCDSCNSLLKQRSDDTPDAIKKRLATYRKTTAPPLTKYYSKKLIEINGNQGIEEVRKEVFSKLGI